MDLSTDWGVAAAVRAGAARVHGHRISPHGGVRRYSPTPFGPTTSYNGFPASGYGNGNGGYGGGFYPR